MVSTVGVAQADVVVDISSVCGESTKLMKLNIGPSTTDLKLKLKRN